ncbi:MAG: 3-deoxy-8-phosphooctulonate synthase [Proteobacteria bacterium]|nr:3-deoxy-8-phosphooctulonate synthase [Pseudomonadota bacterium]
MSTQNYIIIGKDDVNKIKVGNDLPMILIAGPCAIESEEIVMTAAKELTRITKELNIPFIFKASFDKANRTSSTSKRGVGIDEGLAILAKVRDTFGVPVITDVHNENQVEKVAAVVDCLQVPSFLCRQADLIAACAKTGVPTNIKKGQFLAPENMKAVVDNFISCGGKDLMQCERGATFGYNTLVSDFRGLETMKQNAYPVIFDATHSVQCPGGHGTTSGGKREFVEPLSRAALSLGIAGLFMEVHPNPAEAMCDGPNQIPLDRAEELLTSLKKLDDFAKANPIIGIK